MVSCFICKKEFINNSGGQLTTHLKKDHNMPLVDYIILTVYKGISPKCKCGCDDIPNLYRGKFLQYAKGHDSFKRREEIFIEKNGFPKCKTCGVKIGFYRGNPNKYCSSKCSPGEWNQNKVKKTIKEKYGIDNLMQSEIFRKKSQESLKNLWNNNYDRMLDKIKIRSNKKYGVDFPFQSEEIKNKQKETMLENHGVDHYSKTEKFKSDSSNRMILDNPMKIRENVEKMIQTTFENDNHSWKNFHKNYKDTDLTYQSTYEYHFLEFCEENNVLHLVSRAPSFKYLSKKSYHFPDYLFNSEYVIEIKSKWILDLQGGMKIIQEKIKSVEPKYKYLLILDKDYYQFENILKI